MQAATDSQATQCNEYTAEAVADSVAVETRNALFVQSDPDAANVKRLF